MSLWYTETFDDAIAFGLRVERTIYTAHSQFQRIDIVDTAAYGHALALDGIYMTSEKDEHFYHEMLVHPVLTTAPRVEDVLIIGGGDGGTAREVLRHPEVKSVVMCEIDGDVVEACKKYLPGHGAWDDPRLDLKIGDGVQYLKECPAGAFDVVLLDGSDPVGPAEGLFGKAFYANAARVLRKDGVFALQSEGPIVMEGLFRDIVTTLRGLFTHAHPYFGPVPLYAGGIWSWTYCSQTVSPADMKMDRVVHAEETSQYYNRDIHRGAFALPQKWRREFGAPPAFAAV